MDSPIILRVNSLIRWTFYGMFFLTPLIIFPNTYELFEFNKMWFVFGSALIIFFLWFTKIVLLGRIDIKRTPLDIPIGIFVLSHILSTVFSIDPHTSFWGYYSRFNGGLLSILTYVFLYYAFASTFLFDSDSDKKETLKLILVWLFSGLIVALWGLPSHFGFDFTCWLFRGSPDTSCWTFSFQPEVRIFSTLGQPNWLSAFLIALLPVSIAYAIIYSQKSVVDRYESLAFFGSKKMLAAVSFALISLLFYIDMLYTRSNSGFLGFAGGFAVFCAIYIFGWFIKKKSFPNVKKDRSIQLLLAILLLFTVFTFSIGTPITDKIKELLPKSSSPQQTQSGTQTAVEDTKKEQFVPITPLGGSDSGEIRKYVWKGALDVFTHNPLFGTGVETFGYAYYKEKPKEHNLTSEWDFLYNKAHNEFLNYLATTGILGFGSYMAIIIMYLYISIKSFLKNKVDLIALSLLSGFVAINISNFFGFSVVIINMFFFFIPLLTFDLQNKLTDKKFSFVFAKEQSRPHFTTPKSIVVIVFALIILYLEGMLIKLWIADKKFAYGYNLNKVEEYVMAFPYLQGAVELRPGNDTFQDEFSVNLAALALASAQEGNAQQALQLGTKAKQISDMVIEKHPNNPLYYKSRTRVLYYLAQLNPQYLADAISSLEQARKIAPTDAKILYNLGVFYGQTGDFGKALDLLDQTIELKRDYRDAYYAEALFYIQMAEDAKKDNPQDYKKYHDLARERLEFSLNNILSSKDDPRSQELLNSLQDDVVITTEPDTTEGSSQ